MRECSIKPNFMLGPDPQGTLFDWADARQAGKGAGVRGHQTRVNGERGGGQRKSRPLLIAKGKRLAESLRRQRVRLVF
jgi:hypothetical protein